VMTCSINLNKNGFPIENFGNDKGGHCEGFIPKQSHLFKEVRDCHSRYRSFAMTNPFVIPVQTGIQM